MEARVIEEWKAINGYEMYEISTTGKVYSHRSNKLLKHQKSAYPFVRLYKDGKYKNFQIHRLVAMAFIENPSNYEIVNHKDENKYNCNVSNLEWCTRHYNSHYKDNTKKRLEISNYKLQTPVLQIGLDGKVINEYSNIASTPHYKKGFSTICMNGEFFKGYYWRYKHERD